mgnify:CR=1 FL=1
MSNENGNENGNEKSKDTGHVSCLSEYDSFDRESFLANPEPEPVFANSADDPVCRIPPDHVVHDMVIASSADSMPWHFRQPSEEVWEEIWDHVQYYIGGVVVANLDTGCNPHEMLPKPLAMESFINGQSAFDQNGHGSHTCSTSAAKDRKHGVAPGAQLVVVKVLSNQGGGSSSGIAAGNRWAGDWKGDDGLQVDVVNMSLGGGSKYQPTIDAIGTNFEKGILTNCSAGNSGPREGTEGYPARDPSVPSIGATQEDGTIANFSSRGDILVACPGQNIFGASHRSETGVVSMSGTSMSCPFKSGLDALLIALRRASGLPRWRSVQPVMDLYKAYAIDRGRPGKDSSFGHGVPDYRRLVQDMGKFGKELFIKALCLAVLLSFAFASPSEALELKINGPANGQVGDLVVINSIGSEAKVSDWIIPPSLNGKIIKCSGQLGFATRTPGAYTFYLFGTDGETLSSVSHTVLITADGDLPIIPTPDPGTEPDEPDPPITGRFDSLEDLSREKSTALNDPTIRSKLASKLKQESYGDSLVASQTTVERIYLSVLSSRSRDNQDANWYDGWYIPVLHKIGNLANQGRIKNVADYTKAVHAVAAGLSN